MTMTAAPEMTVTAFAAHELLYILQTVDGPISQSATTRLGIDIAPDDESSVRAGLTSLFVRGQIAVSSNEVELSDIAAAVGYVLTASVSWFEIVNVDSELETAAWLVCFDDLAVFIRPQPLATFDVRLLDSAAAAQWLAASTLDFLADDAGRVVYVTHTSTTPSIGIVGRTAESGRLTVTSDTGDVLVTEEVDRARPAAEIVFSQFLSR